jgi:hypothetical protein
MYRHDIDRRDICIHISHCRRRIRASPPRGSPQARAGDGRTIPQEKLARQENPDLPLLDKPKDHIGLFSVVLANERLPIIRGGTSFGYNYVGLATAPKNRRMEPFLFTFPKEIDKRIFFDHDGEEFIFIISGKVEWQMGHEKFLLKSGDSVCLDSRVPHRGRAIGGEAKALVVTCNLPIKKK